MAQINSQRRFIFRGIALPFGGRVISRGGTANAQTIAGPPSSALAVVGGKHRVVSRGSSFQDVFKWGATVAQSEGVELAVGTYRTTVTSSIADVAATNKPFVFTAGLLKISMVADHTQTGQPSITPSEIVFGGDKGMSLDGLPIELEFDTDLKDFPTFSEFEKKYREDRAFFDKYQNVLTHPDGAGKFGDPLPRTPSGYVETSFVHRIRYKKKWRNGNVLYLKGFGRLHFGEVLMKDNNRRVTMVRLDMGSDTEADVVCAEVDPNGSWGN